MLYEWSSECLDSPHKICASTEEFIKDRTLLRWKSVGPRGGNCPEATRDPCFSCEQGLGHAQGGI